MTAFDLVVVAIIGGSMLLAALRGFIRSAVSLGAWVAAIALSLQFGPALAGHLAGPSPISPAAQALGFALVFLGVVVAGALVGMLLARLLWAVGLGAVDRVFGALFGLGRGIVVVLTGVLVAGFTVIPRHDWWQNSVLAPHFVEAVLAVRPYLPAVWRRVSTTRRRAAPARHRGARSNRADRGAFRTQDDSVATLGARPPFRRLLLACSPRCVEIVKIYPGIPTVSLSNHHVRPAPRT